MTSPATATVSRLSAAAPFLAMFAAIVVTWRAWGSLNPIPTVGDEAAYILQAELLAHGHIAGAPAPIPEFFEQSHVLVTPRLAPKYPLGFGLALVPGVLLGATGLVPLLMSGLSGLLLFVLCRRVLGTAPGVLATAIWIAAPGGRYRAGFFSETLTGVTCLLAWYGLLRWRDDRVLRWLVLVTTSLALAAITRPLTALVFAVPVGLVVLRDALRRHSWKPLLLSTLIAVPIVAVLPIQNAATGGPWWELPYGRYTRAYLPFDHMGFGLDTAAPTRTRPPDIEKLAQAYTEFHRDYVTGKVPGALLARLRVYFADLAGAWSHVAILLVVLGVITGPAALRFAAASVGLLFAAHLGYAHPPQWSLYYAEALPAGAAAVAAGAAILAARTSRYFAAQQPADRATTLLALATLLVLLSLPRTTEMTRLGLEVSREPLAAFATATAGISGPSVVFVRYATDRPVRRSLVRNPPDYATARMWSVYDRGTDNARLLALAPERTAYLYDEASGSLARLDPTRPSVSGSP